MLEKHLFNDTTPCADVASKFRVTAAQLHKAITGIDYKSGPHTYKKRRKDVVPDISTSQIQAARPSTSTKVQKTQKTKEIQEPDDPNPAYDTLSSSSSESLYNPFA